MSTPIIRLAFQSLFGRSRLLLLLALPVVLVGLAALLTATGSPDNGNAESFLKVFGIGIVIPVLALVSTASLINAELDDGSIIYLLTKPVSRLSIIASKALVALFAVVACGVIPLWVAGITLVGGADKVAVGALAGGLVSGVAYVGLFTVLMTVLQRSVIACLIYWLVWESTISSLVGPVRWLSARAWGTSTVEAISSVSAKAPAVPVAYAVVAAAVALVVGVVLAARRLAAMTLSDA
ncbi:ABC transporter permease [Luteipulveratus halotolerans]|uniref:ABC transporter permease n=1 Tax=Luteipulveratus halotolerans TaxID=1631356 RepID=A0A0L6CLL0_9MICO|nr:ABC transporter permease [Luteipulveratus halotolerans]KNX38418.1 hypothetical protein VV01_16730 [Luteipulveratus halotolerans]